MDKLKAKDLFEKYTKKLRIVGVGHSVGVCRGRGLEEDRGF